MPGPPEPPLSFATLADYLTSVSGWIGNELTRFLPHGEPWDWLYRLVADYPARGGKRMRPALLILCATLRGGPAERALPSALALELFQNFALIHDDIEDDSLLRRGRPTLHRLHGVPLALNAGDVAYGLVYEAMLENEAVLGATLAMEVMRRFAAMFRHTFEGQALDIGWVRNNHMPDREEFGRMIRLKTGWYSGRGPCEIGALIGGCPPEEILGLGDYGERLGIGFQVRDDLLNLIADSAETPPAAHSGGYGKEQGGDIAEGKRTLIMIEMMERLPADQAQRLRAILIEPPQATSQQDIRWVIQRAWECGAVDAVKRRCAELGRAARDALAFLPPSPHRRLLEELTNYLVLERVS